jgi:pimeloyl-ACP methyl ester carboxylesterase
MDLKEPLILLHPLGTSPRAWERVRPLLEPHHDVLALATVGHRGGVPARRRPVAIADLVDDVERALDERGLKRPHVAGNSLGGWMAIELARRDRAETVCAISPAGSWTAGTPEQTRGARKIRRAILSARLGRALPMSLLVRAGFVRRLIFRDVAVHGERLSPAQALESTRDLLGCTIADDILTTTEEIAPLDPLPCPVTLVWAGEDALMPLAVNGPVARARLPQAEFSVLDGVGHVPMIDDPPAVAQAILETTARSTILM